jgi:hypothetical protein
VRARAKHPALAAALLQGQLAALQLVADLTHDVLGAGRFPGDPVAVRQRDGEQPLRLGALGAQGVAPAGQLLGPALSGRDTFFELAPVVLEAAQFRFGGRRALAQAGHHAARLR